MGRNCTRALEKGPSPLGERAVFKSKATVSPHVDRCGK